MQTEKTVGNYLISLGVNPCNKGFDYLIDAVLMLIRAPELKSQITKQVYARVANKHHTSTTAVERCIRHSVQGVYDTYQGQVNMEALLGPNAAVVNRGKATNATFMSTVAWHMRQEDSKSD